jgi:hypothetical protein
MNIRIRIPDSVHLVQTPFDLHARGEVTVTVRDTGAVTRGGLTMERGTLNLFGHDHRLVEGSLAFTDEHPKGWLALTFERQLAPATLRDRSKASAGTAARVTFAGPPTKPKTSLGGASNAALAEVMAAHNTGHPVHVSGPGLPASGTVQAPRGDQLSVLTFMASNLPHLLFLDRITAWADPYRAPASYGRINHVEAERTTGKTRIRAVARPVSPGRSTAELQYDRMFIDGDRASFGVGLRAGSRVGGGVGVFFEWSSED